MRKSATRALTVILSFALTVNMCPTAAFATATGTQGPEITEEFDQSATVDKSDIDLALYEQPEMPSEHTAYEPGGTNADAAESAHGNADDGARAAQTSKSSSADSTTSPDNTSESKNATQAPEASSASAAAYAHTATAEQNGVTFTVEWNDAPAGTATTFHVSQTGGSANAKVRMDVPVYFDGGSQEIVCDPSRGDWKPYHSLGADGHDYTFEFTASGTYRIYFYFLDGDSGIWYLRTAAQITVSDATRPSVSRIVNDAVARCRRETDGSEYAMALWLHDWTLDQLEYDRSLNWCSAESGLTRRLGTCESYQRIYAKLLDAAGIANGRIVGNGHTWNAVRIDGKWCQMDLTWDDSSGNWYGDLDQRHLYFGLTDELMAIAHSDHTANYQSDDYAYRSTDLSNAYFVRNGKADEWAEAYADRIQQRLDAKETEFSIDADNASFPPSISGIQNALIAYAMNQREWTTGGNKVDLTAASTVTEESTSKWSAKYEFRIEYPDTPPAPDIPSIPNRVIADGAYTVTAAIAPGMGVAASESGCSLSSGAGALGFERDAATGLYRISSGGKLLTESGAAAVLAEADGSDSQLWRLEECEWGYTVTASSGLALDDRYCETAEGSTVWLYEPNGSAAQAWVIARRALPRVIADGAYTVTAAIAPGMGVAASESGCSLSSGAGALGFERDAATGLYRISSGGKLLTESGAAAVLAEADGSDSQLWRLEECEWGYTVTASSGLALDDRYCETAEGSTVWLYEPNGSAAQAWVIARRALPRVIADGAYTVTAAIAPGMGVAASESGCSLSSGAGALGFERDAATGLYRISSGGKLLTESGAAAVLAEADGSDSQLWRLEECEWGYTVTASSGLALDDRYCETAEGSTVWLYEPNGSAAQAWKFI